MLSQSSQSLGLLMCGASRVLFQTHSQISFIEAADGERGKVGKGPQNPLLVITLGVGQTFVYQATFCCVTQVNLTSGELGQKKRKLGAANTVKY